MQAANRAKWDVEGNMTSAIGWPVIGLRGVAESIEESPQAYLHSLKREDAIEQITGMSKTALLQETPTLFNDLMAGYEEVIEGLVVDSSDDDSSTDSGDEPGLRSRLRPEANIFRPGLRRHDLEQRQRSDLHTNLRPQAAPFKPGRSVHRPGDETSASSSTDIDVRLARYDQEFGRRSNDSSPEFDNYGLGPVNPGPISQPMDNNLRGLGCQFGTKAEGKRPMSDNRAVRANSIGYLTNAYERRVRNT